MDGPAPRPGASGAGAPGAIKLHNTKLSGALLIGSAPLLLSFVIKICRAQCPHRAAEKRKAIPHNSKCRYGERGAADAKPKAQIMLDAAKVSAASGGNSEPKQGQRSQSARGFCPRSTMRVPQPDIIEHFGNADAVPQLPERCLSRKAGIVRCCPKANPARCPHKQAACLFYRVASPPKLFEQIPCFCLTTPAGVCYYIFAD